MSSAEVSSAAKVEMEKEPPKPEPRLLHSVGRQIIIHVHIISVLCYTAGVVAVFLLPLLASNTHISENALMPGSGNPMYTNSDTVDARASAAKLKTLVSQSIPQDAQREVSRWLIKEMIDLGADCNLHPFFPPKPTWLSGYVPLSHDFKGSTSNLSQTDDLERRRGLAINVVGIIRAPQGEGTEAIVLVTPFHSNNFGQGDGLSLGIGLALFARLSKALWTARDVIWVVADSKYGAYPAVAEWLREYHEPGIEDFSIKAKIRSELVEEFFSEGQSSVQHHAVSLSDFKRAGTIATGLVFEVKIAPGESGDTMKLRAEGPNGQMPNLDLINIINSISAWRESLTLQLETLPFLRNSAWLNSIGHFLEKVSSLARQANPAWNFALGAAAYPNNFATLLSSMYYQVIGLPTGAHGAFRDYQIDAVSLQLPVPQTVFDHSLTKFGRLLEGVLRSVNNLLEKWHHSFFLYFLSAPHRYISVGVYMPPLVLLLASLPLTAVALCHPSKEEEKKTTSSEESKSVVGDNSAQPALHSSGFEKDNPEGRSAAVQALLWLRALLLVSSVQIWACFVALLVFFLSQTNFPQELKLVVWLVLVTASLKVSVAIPELFPASGNGDMSTSPLGHGNTQFWAALKASTLGVTSIGLGVMSTINYPVALVGALVLVPMCLGVFPLQYIWTYAERPGKSILICFAFALGAFVTILGSPPVLTGLVWYSGGNFSRESPTNFWYFMESLLGWRSALFPYMLVIHLPCSVLCTYILFSSHQPHVIKR